MRSSRHALVVSAFAAIAAAAGCAPKDAPVCRPAYSWVMPAYGCADTAAPPAPVVVEAPPPVEVAPPPIAVAPPKVLLGSSSIELAEPIQFEAGTAALSPGSSQLLDQVATTLVEHPEILKIQIEVHTDSSGSNAANLKLSQARAETVRTYLGNFGVAATRMVAKGAGETRPISDNSTEAGRAQNRRVVFTILSRAP